ncbi:MAG: DUF4831 family protein [Bacteroidales bacterium]|nr:DUF4831 family protein [Bacteroidales bacterium]
MRKLFYGLFLPASILLAISCAPSQRTSSGGPVITPLAGKSEIRDGSLVYALPLTVIDVFVETERVIELPGPYSRHAGDYLGLSDVITEEDEYWTIKSITVRTHEELDPSEFYVIESNTMFQTNLLSMKKAGLILDLNPQAYSIYDAHRGQVAGKDADLEPLRVLDLGADEYYLSQSDTAYRLVNYDTGFVRIPYLVEKKRKLTVDQLAERAARRLMELRDGKHLILTGEANVFPQSEAAIAEMNRLEKEYTELFTGKIWKETKTFSYQIIPRKEMAESPVALFRFSEVTGPGATTDKTGTPVIVEFTPEQKTKDLAVIRWTQPAQGAMRYDKIYYRVPDVVNVRIYLGNEILNSSRRLICQFGEVMQLPANYIIGTPY